MTELVDVLEQQYALKLEHRAKQWERHNPDQAKAIREQVATEFALAGQPNPEPGSLRWHVFEQDVVEKIRVLKGWRTVRQWMLDPANNPPVAPTYNAPKITPPAVEREDRQRLAAGDRE
jgi:hypothetical protein